MLIIFDVDGTLIGGEEYDWKAFNDAFTDVTGREFSVEFWKSLEEVTASAIVHQGLSDLDIHERIRLEHQVRDRCLENLIQSRSDNPGAFTCTDGASELLEFLHQSETYDVAIATGDWFKTIQYKLDTAGIGLERYSHATSSDALIRSEIIKTAASRTTRTVEEAVYVGDGVWDIRACRQLNIPFIGTGQRIDKLKEEGAQWTLPNLETEEFLATLDQLRQRGNR